LNNICTYPYALGARGRTRSTERPSRLEPLEDDFENVLNTSKSINGIAYNVRVLSNRQKLKIDVREQESEDY
jgi:hypothetical protein